MRDHPKISSNLVRTCQYPRFRSRLKSCLKFSQESLGVSQFAPRQPCISLAHPVFIVVSRPSLADNLFDLPFLLFMYPSSGPRLLATWRIVGGERTRDRCESVIVFAGDLATSMLRLSHFRRERRSIERFDERLWDIGGIQALEGLWIFSHVGIEKVRSPDLWLNDGDLRKGTWFAKLFVIVLNDDRLICSMSEKA